MRNFLILVFSCLLLVLPVLHLQAQVPQPLVVKGKVLNKATKKPIENVSISEVDADDRILKGTATDIEGNFVLRITNTQNRITISYIGYKTITQSLATRTIFNVQMEEAGNSSGDVTVVSSRRTSNGLNDISDRNLTTAVAKINAKDLEEMPAVTIDQALQGRLAGVDITASSGDPGAAMNIRIRGTSSINSSGNPLIVVDGMPFETTIPSDFNFGTADEQGYAQLLSIAPSDIKDITVLKDAAATAVWGARAASGVLLITTKRGARAKPSVTYTFRGATYQRPKAIPMLNGDQYSTLIPEAFMNRIGTTLNTTQYREFNYDPNDPYWYYNYSNNTNWVDALAQTGYLQDHNISMSGGGEKARYFASVGYTNQQGTTIGTGLDRINTRINLDYNVSEKIKIFTSIAYTHSDQQRNYLSSDDGAIRSVAYKKMPNMSIFEYDELGNLTPNYFSPASNVQGTYTRIYNPVAMADKAKFGVISERVLPRFQASYAIIKNVLNARFDIQFDINNTKNNSFLPQIATGRPSTETVVNRAYDGDIDVFSVTTKSNLDWTPKFKNSNHELGVYLNLLTTDQKVVNQEVLVSNTASSLLVDASVPARSQNSELRAVSGISQYRNLHGVAMMQYGFKSRYIFNLSISGDGNSRFGPAYRYGAFPSASLKYRVSDEKFLRGFKKLDDLSFRLSYGVVGNAPSSNYLFYNTYNTFDWSYLGQAAVYPSAMELSNLRWEKVVGTNVGANISMFKGQLRADVDVYRQRTKDLFFNNLQIASYTGFSSVAMNIGTMDNQGWEVALYTQPYKSKNMTVNFNFNASHNENVIREISEFYPSTRGNVANNGEYYRVLQINNPFGSIYGYRYKGVYPDKASTLATNAGGKPITGPTGQQVYMRFNYPSTDYVFQPGDAMYEDVNHDGNIDYKDIVYLGNSNPKLSGGFGPQVSWNKIGLTLSAFFSFRYDYDVVNGTKMNTSNMYGFDNQSTAVLRRWKKEGDITDIPRALIGGGYNFLGSDRYVEDASYLRFRTANIRYNFPQSKLARIKLKSLSTYFTVDNIFTITNYTGQDPEVSTRGADPFRIAADYSMTPPTRTFTLGIQAGF